eukprot:1975078-Rhodomonas_salina.1
MATEAALAWLDAGWVCGVRRVLLRDQARRGHGPWHPHHGRVALSALSALSALNHLFRLLRFVSSLHLLFCVSRAAGAWMHRCRITKLGCAGSGNSAATQRRLSPPQRTRANSSSRCGSRLSERKLDDGWMLFASTKLFAHACCLRMRSWRGQPTWLTHVLT